MERAQDIPDSHVTISQCSVRSIPSEEDGLPMLSSSQCPQQVKVPTHRQTPNLRYTYNTEKRLKHTSYLTPRQHTPDVEQHAPSPIHRVETSQTRPVFLPRLTDLDLRVNQQTKLTDGREAVHLPEINVISRCNARFALHRSITDLLDPEMEILNKIKHTPRRKRKRRKQPTPYPDSVTVTLKIDVRNDENMEVDQNG